MSNLIGQVDEIINMIELCSSNTYLLSKAKRLKSSLIEELEVEYEQV